MFDLPIAVESFAESGDWDIGPINVSKPKKLTTRKTGLVTRPEEDLGVKMGTLHENSTENSEFHKWLSDALNLNFSL